MSFGTLSPESRAGEMMRDLSITNAYVAVLCKIEPSRLSLCLRQLKRFSPEEGKRVVNILRRLLELRGAVTPLCVISPNPEHTRRVIDTFAGLDVVEIRRRVDRLFSMEVQDVK